MSLAVRFVTGREIAAVERDENRAVMDIWVTEERLR